MRPTITTEMNLLTLVSVTDYLMAPRRRPEMAYHALMAMYFRREPLLHFAGMNLWLTPVHFKLFLGKLHEFVVKFFARKVGFVDVFLVPF